MSKPKVVEKPNLVKIGKHYLNPDSVAGFKQAKEGLYIIVIKESPELQYPLWVSERAVNQALQYFNIPNVEDDDE